MPVSPTLAQSFPSGPIRRRAAVVVAAVRRDAGEQHGQATPMSTVPFVIVTRTTWLKRPVELAQPVAEGALR